MDNKIVADFRIERERYLSEITLTMWREKSPRRQERELRTRRVTFVIGGTSTKEHVNNVVLRHSRSILASWRGEVHYRLID